VPIPVTMLAPEASVASGDPTKVRRQVGGSRVWMDGGQSPNVSFSLFHRTGGAVLYKAYKILLMYIWTFVFVFGQN